MKKKLLVYVDNQLLVLTKKSNSSSIEPKHNIIEKKLTAGYSNAKEIYIAKNWRIDRIKKFRRRLRRWV